MTSFYSVQLAVVAIGLLIILAAGCVDKMPLPAEINVPVEFSAGDTTYLRMNPIWDETYGLVAPVEVSVAPDGHIFVADSGANTIIVLKQDGSVLESFGGLKDLEDSAGQPLRPIDVDIDEKMNVFFHRWIQTSVPLESDLEPCGNRLRSFRRHLCSCHQWPKGDLARGIRRLGGHGQP